MSPVHNAYFISSFPILTSFFSCLIALAGTLTLKKKLSESGDKEHLLVSFLMLEQSLQCFTITNNVCHRFFTDNFY